MELPKQQTDILLKTNGLYVSCIYVANFVAWYFTTLSSNQNWEHLLCEQFRCNYNNLTILTSSHGRESNVDLICICMLI